MHKKRPIHLKNKHRSVFNANMANTKYFATSQYGSVGWMANRWTYNWDARLAKSPVFLLKLFTAQFTCFQFHFQYSVLLLQKGHEIFFSMSNRRSAFVCAHVTVTKPSDFHRGAQRARHIGNTRLPQCIAGTLRIFLKLFFLFYFKNLSHRCHVSSAPYSERSPRANLQNRRICSFSWTLT